MIHPHCTADFVLVTFGPRFSLLTMEEEKTENQAEVSKDPAEDTPVETQDSASKVEEPVKEPAQTSTGGEVKKEADIPPNSDDIEELTTLHERAIATLSYFGPFAIIPFYLKKNSKFCRFHGKQGMTVAIIFFLAQFASVLDIIMDLLLILQAIVALWMGFVAISGRWKKMPLIYKWSCQLEKAISLKTKEEEANDMEFKPDQVKPDEPSSKQ